MNLYVARAGSAPVIIHCVRMAIYIENVSRTESVSYTHLRAHETDSYLVCRLLLEKKKDCHSKDIE